MYSEAPDFQAERFILIARNLNPVGSARPLRMIPSRVDDFGGDGEEDLHVGRWICRSTLLVVSVQWSCLRCRPLPLGYLTVQSLPLPARPSDCTRLPPSAIISLSHLVTTPNHPHEDRVDFRVRSGRSSLRSP